MRDVVQKVREFYNTHDHTKNVLWRNGSFMSLDNHYLNVAPPPPEKVHSACIYGAFYCVTGYSCSWKDRRIAEEIEFAKFLGFEDTSDLVRYNNLEKTTKQDIINLLDKSLEKLI
jgi:hypothetical protein